MAHDADFRRELGQQLRVDSVRSSAAAGSGHPTSSMSAADLMAVLHRRPPPARLRQPGQPGQRPPDLLQGPRLAAVLRGAEGGRRDRRRGAADVPQARLAARRATPRRGSRRPTSPPARWARACRSASASRWPAARSTSCRSASGCCAATPRWPRARCGRPSSTPAGKGSTTSPRSSTSTASARRARRCSAGTSTATCAGSRPSAGRRSRSTATTWRPSRPPTPRPRPPRASPSRSSPRR